MNLKVKGMQSSLKLQVQAWGWGQGGVQGGPFQVSHIVAVFLKQNRSTFLCSMPLNLINFPMIKFDSLNNK